MSDLISVRLDSDAQRALSELEATGRPGLRRSGVGYLVTVHADALLRLSTLLVAPTSSRAHGASFGPEIQIDGSTTRVLVEQTGAIDVSRLGDHHGHLSVGEQWGVDLALETVLDLQQLRCFATGSAATWCSVLCLPLARPCTDASKRRWRIATGV